MYEKFYGLGADPFRLSPDHRFSFSHPTYAKARAYIQYALHRAEGFVMVTGKPGTGKTTLVNEVLNGLPRAGLVVATLVSTQLEADDLLRMAAYSFGLPADAPQKALVLQRVMDFLFRQHREGRRALLMIDEAQDLSDSALEELRLLTNLQHAGQPLLQIVLLGQESLRELVRKPNMEQVQQRLVAACDLEPLGPLDSLAYVAHRLAIAGWRGDPKFEREIWPLVYEFSKGVPRRINLVCSRLLLHGCVEQRHTLTAEDAESVVAEMALEDLTPAASAADAASLQATESVGNQPARKGAKPLPLAQDQGGAGSGKRLRSMLRDPLEGFVDNEIARRLADGQETGITREPESVQEAPPATVDDAGYSPVSGRRERPEQLSSPQARRVAGLEAEDRWSHQRSRSGGSLSDAAKQGPRRDPPHADDADASPGVENGGGKDSTRKPRETLGSGMSLRQRAAPAPDPEGSVLPASRTRTTAARTSSAFRTERPGMAPALRTRAVVTVVLGIVAVVAMVSYFRIGGLEGELRWIERQMAATVDRARALFVQLTAVDNTQGNEIGHGQPGREVVGIGSAATTGDETTAIGDGPIEYAGNNSAGSARPGSEPVSVEAAGQRKIAPAAPKDASRATGE